MRILVRKGNPEGEELEQRCGAGKVGCKVPCAWGRWEHSTDLCPGPHHGLSVTFQDFHCPRPQPSWLTVVDKQGSTSLLITHCQHCVGALHLPPFGSQRAALGMMFIGRRRKVKLREVKSLSWSHSSLTDPRAVYPPFSRTRWRPEWEKGGWKELSTQD